MASTEARPTPALETEVESERPKPNIFKDYLPPWVYQNLISWDSWKVVIRAWIATWVAFILILPNASLAVLGNAAFFSAFSLLIIPPMFPVQTYFLATSTMLIGCLMGWAWGCAAMAAATHARNKNVTAAVYQREESSLQGKSNPDQLFQIDIFRGVFLDPASSAVFGIFLATGSFFFAWMRTRAPKLAIFSVFGSIFLDVICSYGVLFPTEQYLILQTFLISAPVGVAIGVVCTVLIFPQTMAYGYMKTFSKTLTDVERIIGFQRQVIGVDPEAAAEAWNRVESDVIGKRQAMLAAIQGLEGQGGMLDLEFSRGRYNATDLKDLLPPLQRTAAAASGLAIYTEIIRNWRQEIKDGAAAAQTSRSGSVDGESPPKSASLTEKPPLSTNGLHPKPKRSAHVDEYLKKSRELEESQGHQIHKIMPLLRDASLPLIDACCACLSALTQVLDAQNASRWHRATSVSASHALEEDLALKLAEFKEVLAAFESEKRLEVLQPYESIMKIPMDFDSGKSDLPFSLRPLYFVFTFQTNLINFASNEVALLDAVEELQVKRKVHRFWAPTGLRKLFHVAFSKGTVIGDPMGLGDPVLDQVVDGSQDSVNNIQPEPKTTKSDVEKQVLAPVHDEARDPDAGPPTNALHKFGRVVYRFYKWNGTAQGLFCWKYSLISVALWMPMVFKNSVYFTYTNKGLWALIMGQTGLSVYVSDQLANYAMRLTGTFAGLLLGMVIWYMGNGHGHGNPYTTALVLAVFLLPAQFLRVNSPPKLMPLFLLTGVTTSLVVGYSWIDDHIPTLGNIGVGWAVAWRRWLLVMIGIAASTVLMVIPPKSSRSMIRNANAKGLLEISRFYTQLIEGWIDAGDTDYRAREPGSKGRVELDKFKTRFINASSRLALLKQQTALSGLEFNMRGPWAQKDYLALAETQSHMLDALYQLGGVLYHLDPSWRHRLIHRTVFLNPNLVQEINSIFLILSGSLRTSTPVHATIPASLLDRLFMYHMVQPRDTPRRPDTGELLTYGEILTDENLAVYASATIAINYFVQQLDKAQSIVRKLCGEVRLGGFEEFREEYERRQREIEAER